MSDEFIVMWLVILGLTAVAALLRWEFLHSKYTFFCWRCNQRYSVIEKDLMDNLSFTCPTCKSLEKIAGIDWKTVVEDEDKGKGIYY